MQEKDNNINENLDVEQNENVEEKELNEDALKNFKKPIEINSKEEMYEGLSSAQKAFTDYFNKNKKVNTIIVVVFMALIVVAIFGLGQNGNAMPLILGLVIVYFIVLFVFSKRTKTKLNADADKIINDYFLNVDSYITQNEHFSDVCFDVNAKMEEERIKELRIVKDINHVGGRDVIVGKIDNHPFISGDVLVKTKETVDEKTQQFIVFLGKMFIVERPNIVNDGRIIIYLKGKGANGPTDIEDLTLQENVLSDKFAVYSSCDVSNVLNENVVALFEQYENNELLIDMFITIDASRVSFGFSFSDAVMRVPLLDEFKAETIDQYKQDVERMIAIFTAIK